MRTTRQGLKLAGAYIDGTKHDELCKLARANNRTLADQCRVIFDDAISNPASIPDASVCKKKEPQACAKTPSKTGSQVDAEIMPPPFICTQITEKQLEDVAWLAFQRGVKITDIYRSIFDAGLAAVSKVTPSQKEAA